MNIQAKLVAGLFLILAVLAGIFAIYKYGRHVEFITQDNLRKEAIIQATEENDALKAKLGEQHAQAEAALNTILATPAPRLRPTCPSSESNPAVGGQVPITPRERTDFGNQEVLDRLTGSLDAKAAEWSRALSACRVVMEWANHQTR